MGLPRASRMGPICARMTSVRINCPICKKVIADAPADYPPRPFCSPRCKLVDLDNWLNERYAISEPLPSDAEDDGQLQ